MDPSSGPNQASADDDGDRPSITEVNGTIARFEMAYSPTDSDLFRFGPPLSQRIGSFLYLGFASVLVLAVIVAYLGGTHSRLSTWIIEGDSHRAFGAVPLSCLIFLSAIATVVRAGMRGVLVTAAGIEARYILPLGVPRIRKWSWAQIDRFVIDDTSVMLELWDGSYEQLPKVAKQGELGTLLQRIATARGRQVTLLHDVSR